jgi:hypothetical protein
MLESEKEEKKFLFSLSRDALFEILVVYMIVNYFQVSRKICHEVLEREKNLKIIK